MNNDFTLSVGGDVSPGTYLCILTGWEPFSADYEGEQRDLMRWTFAVDETDDTIVGVSSRATGPKSKLRAWALGLGVDLREVTSLHPSDLIGREALVTVTMGDNGYTKIDAVVPVPKSRSKA